MRNIFIIAILLLSTVPAYARASLDKGAWNPEYTVRTLSAASRASSLSLPAAKSTEINADTMAASHAADTIAPAAASAPAVTAESADTTGSGKQQKKPDDHIKSLIVADQFPVPVYGRLFLYVEIHQDIYKDSGKAVVVNSVDHVIQQKTAHQHGKSRDQQSLQKHAEL